MKSINATTQQQVDNSKLEVLKSIASYFKDNLPTASKKTTTSTLKAEATDFKSEIDKIITEGDLSGAFKKFNDKLTESGETISDYIDAQDNANKEFIKRFNKYSKERTNAERKQSNLARENIATRIDENNELQILKNFEIDEKQKEIKNLRDEIEIFQKELKKKKNLTAEEIAAKFDEIEERRLQIREIKDLGVKEKKKFDDTMFRFELLDNAIAFLDEETLKTRQSVGNFITGITPDPIIDAFRTFTSAFATAIQPLLGFLKPLKIFIPLIKLFGFLLGKTVVKPLRAFGRFLVGSEKATKKLGEQTIETTEDMKKAGSIFVNSAELVDEMREKHGVADKKRTGLFGKLSGAVGKVTGAFTRILPMIIPLTILIGVLTAAFFLFKDQILGLLERLGIIAPRTNIDETKVDEAKGGATFTQQMDKSLGISDKVEREKLAIKNAELRKKEGIITEENTPGAGARGLIGKSVDEIGPGFDRAFLNTEADRLKTMTPEKIRELYGEAGEMLALEKEKDFQIGKKDTITQMLMKNLRIFKTDEEDVKETEDALLTQRIKEGFGTDEQLLERGTYTPTLRQMDVKQAQGNVLRSLQTRYDASRVKTAEIESIRKDNMTRERNIQIIQHKQDSISNNNVSGKKSALNPSLMQKYNIFRAIFG